MKLKQPHAGLQKGPQNPLLAELRKSPFRPIHVEELAQLKEAEYAKPKKVKISPEGYRALYERTFAFTGSGASLNLALIEAGFRLDNDGGIAPKKDFLRFEKLLNRALGAGLSRALSAACREWECRAAKKGFDPEDEAEQTERVWFGSFERKINSIQWKVMGERGGLGPAGLLGFNYMDGFPYCNEVPGEASKPCEKPRCRPEKQGNTLCRTLSQHSHAISHLNGESYFPSWADMGSPVIWAPIDFGFIRAAMKNASMGSAEKAGLIINRHVDGMARAECVGVWARCVGEIIPLVLAK